MATEPQALSLDSVVSSLGDHMADAVIITEAEPLLDVGPRIVWVNRSFEAMTGYTLEDVIGKTPRVLQGPDTDPETRRRIRAGLLAWQPVREEIKNYRKDGSPFWVELTIRPVADESGWFHYWVSTQREVTDKRRDHEQTLHKARLESMGRMTSGVAHDFNNVLAVILGNLEMLQRQSDGLQDHPLLRISMDAVRRGRRLTESLLSFAGRSAMVPVCCDLGELVREAEVMARSVLADDIDLQIETDEEPCAVLVDPQFFQNALMNLVVNARDALDGSGRIRISVQSVAAEQLPFAGGEFFPDHGRVLVEDNGSGIPADILERVIEPFFSTKETGAGSGLGLSMVHGFVEQSRGRLHIDSEPGKGSRISMFFPRVTVPVERRGEAAIDEATVLDGARVLLVEDDAELRQLFEYMLESAGAVVESAYDGRDALRILEYRDNFDLLLSDVMMPGAIQGTQVATEFRQRTGDRPVLLVTGNPARVDADAGWQVLQKPVDRATLLAAVAVALAEHRQRDA